MGVLFDFRLTGKDRLEILFDLFDWLFDRFHVTSDDSVCLLGEHANCVVRPKIKREK